MINVSFIGRETGVMKKKKDKLRDEHSYDSRSFRKSGVTSNPPLT